MLHSTSLSTSRPHSSPTIITKSNYSFQRFKSPNSLNCGLRGDFLGFDQLKQSNYRRFVLASSRSYSKKKLSASLSDNGSPPTSFDYDLVIIGAGVGGHGAALHAVEKVKQLLYLIDVEFVILRSD